MINAAQAQQLTDTVVSGTTPSEVPSTERVGNTLLDQCNFNVCFAAMAGKYTTYVPITNYTSDMINNCIDTLENLGYDVDRSRERSYKEIVLLWD